MMKTWLLIGVSGCLFSCELIFRPDSLLYVENTEAKCHDDIDNDGVNGKDCADPSCEAICNPTPPDDDFSISALSSNNCNIIDQGAITGDDRGVVVAGNGNVVYSGDITAATFAGDGLTPQPYGILYDAVFSDIGSGKIYSFIDVNGVAITGPSGDAAAFQEIDPQSGSLIGSSIAMSQIISTLDAGFFSGAGLAVVIDSANNAFSVSIADGAVTSLGVAACPHQSCENKAFGGVVESVDDQLSLVYIEDSRTIKRRSLNAPVPTEEVVASFATLGDMCSLSVSPELGRWYFHAEGFTSLTPLSEHLGFCDAHFGELGAPNCGDGIFQSPEECDDANNTDNDGCTDCQLDFCGDGLTNNAVQGNALEACDDGNNVSGDGCRGDCLGKELCGDGLLDPGEECDDGNNNNGDGCEANCTFICGNTLSPKVAYLDQSSGHCYVILNVFAPWQSGLDACIAAGGDLASLLDPVENNLVLQGATNFQAWIGFNDIAQEGNFAWSDGSAVSAFTSFDAGEPNDIGGEDCVAFNENGLWNDFPCTDNHKPLCELVTQ